MNNAQETVKTKSRLNGTVISDKMTNAVVVRVTRKTRHPLYKKTMVKSKNYKAQNLLGAKTGDKVVIEESRPISRDIRFKVITVSAKAHVIKELAEEQSDLELLLGHNTEESNEVKEEKKKKE